MLEWVNERLSLTAFFRQQTSGVHVVHISHVTITYTLDSLSSLTQMGQCQLGHTHWHQSSHIQIIHGMVIAAAVWGYQCSPHFATKLEHILTRSHWTKASYTLPHILGEKCLEVRTGKSFLKFPQATVHQWQQWHSHNPHQSTAYHLGSRKCQGAVDIHFSHSSAMDGPTDSPIHLGQT